MSVWDDMAHDAGYRGQEARYLAEQLEREEMERDQRRTYEQDMARQYEEACSRCWDAAVQLVDGRHGYAVEFAPDPTAHRAEYEQECMRLLGEEGLA